MNRSVTASVLIAIGIVLTLIGVLSSEWFGIREDAGDRDIRIGGGADVVQQYLDAGLVDELHLAIAPVLFGDGRRLLERIDTSRISLEIQEVLPSPRATHLRYRVTRSAA